MDFVWVQRGSCVFAKAISVVGVTIRQFPHAVVTRRFRQDLPEIIDQLLIRWITRPLIAVSTPPWKSAPCPSLSSAILAARLLNELARIFSEAAVPMKSVLSLSTSS